MVKSQIIINYLRLIINSLKKKNWLIDLWLGRRGTRDNWNESFFRNST